MNSSWSLSASDMSHSGRSTPPPRKLPRKSMSDIGFGQPEESLIRPSPLPPVSFGDCQEVWELMCETDVRYKKDLEVFQKHPVLSPQMRAILLDWLMDVCEAYSMHRETLYLATDFLDRYLSIQSNILKNHLQLIGKMNDFWVSLVAVVNRSAVGKLSNLPGDQLGFGETNWVFSLLGITCLFVAAKVEEIYPPKLSTFAYVTDGACTEQEILDMEIVVMTTLKWKLTPITPASWVNVFLQILSVTPQRVNCLHFLRSRAIRLNLTPPEPEDMHLVAPNYAGIDYVRALRIIDLTIMDLQSFHYSYSELAASSIYHTKGRDAALGASGYKWEDLAPCVNWMAPFAAVVKKHDVPDVLPGISGVSDEARHLIQSHSITLPMLEQVEVLNQASKICSPMTHSEGLLTPPRSSKKRKKPSPGLADPYF